MKYKVEISAFKEAPFASRELALARWEDEVDALKNDGWTVLSTGLSVSVKQYKSTEDHVHVRPNQEATCSKCEEVTGDSRIIENPPAKIQSCNRHNDCDKADAEARLKGATFGASHCHDDSCEDCFGC
jgi:hypothetical protein